METIEPARGAATGEAESPELEPLPEVEEGRERPGGNQPRRQVGPHPFRETLQGVEIEGQRVFEDGGKKATVEIGQADPKSPPKKVEIKTGISDGLNVEVIEGLKKGDRLVERPPKEIS